MPARRLVALVVLVVCCAALLVAWIWPSRGPAEVQLVSLELSGVLDDAGTELWLVTLSISPLQPGSFVFADEWIKVEAKFANRWVETKNRCGLIRLWPGAKRAVQVLLPFGTEACRLHLKYAPEPLKSRLWRYLGPRGQRAANASPRIRNWFWPNRSPPPRWPLHWRPISPELVLPHSADWRASASARAHDERVEVNAL